MPAVRIIPLDPDHARSLSVAIAGQRPSDAEIDAAWAAMRRDNPNLFDGPIILVETPTASTPILRGSRATYRHVATTSVTGRHARSLGVKAIALAHDRSGTEHALIGLRGSSTRMYPGLWELAPAGSVEPSGDHTSAVPLASMLKALGQEALEEVGIDLRAAVCSPVALVDDDSASSLDVLFQCLIPPAASLPRLPCVATHDARGEYAATEWVPVDRLADWVRRSPGAIAPPTAAIISWLEPSLGARSHPAFRQTPGETSL